MKLMALGAPLHEETCDDTVVCLVGIANTPSQEVLIDGTNSTLITGGRPSVCFTFVTRYKEKTVQSDVKHINTTEGFDLFRKEFMTKLPQLKKEIDDEKNSPPVETTSVDSSTNP